MRLRNVKYHKHKTSFACVNHHRMSMCKKKCHVNLKKHLICMRSILPFSNMTIVEFLKVFFLLLVMLKYIDFLQKRVHPNKFSTVLKALALCQNYKSYSYFDIDNSHSSILCLAVTSHFNWRNFWYPIWHHSHTTIVLSDITLEPFWNVHALVTCISS